MPRKKVAVLLVVCALFVPFVTDVFAEDPPSGWFWQDIGDVGLAGSNSFAEGVWTVSGAGADIWGAADALRFVYHPTATNGEMVARVTGMENTHEFAKAGIMIRENLGANAAMVILDVKPDGGVEFMSRLPGNEVHFIAGTSVTMPAWLKLVRAGYDISGFVSQDGEHWTEVGNTPFLSGQVQAGLAVTSHDPSVLNTSTFDHVEFVTVNLPPEWLASDVGFVNLQGDATAFNVELWRVHGAGADIWGQEDGFQYAFKELHGNGEIIVRVDSQPSNIDEFAKAGIMMRALTAGDNPPAANEAHVILDVRPNGEIEFMTRPSTGAETTFLAGRHVALPIWLRLERFGDTVIGATSPDGATWQQIGTAPVPFGDSAYASGLAVTSHDLGVLNDVVYGKVVVTERQ